MADNIMGEHTILIIIVTARGQTLSRQAEALIWMWDESAGKATGEAHAGSAANRGQPCPVRVHMPIPWCAKSVINTNQHTGIDTPDTDGDKTPAVHRDRDANALTIKSSMHVRYQQA